MIKLPIRLRTGTSNYTSGGSDPSMSFNIYGSKSSKNVSGKCNETKGKSPKE